MKDEQNHYEKKEILKILDLKKIFSDKLDHSLKKNFYCGEDLNFSFALKSKIKGRVQAIFDSTVDNKDFQQYIFLLEQEGDHQLLDHSLNTAIYASVVATMMYYPNNEIEDILIAGLLHDIGKIELKSNNEEQSSDEETYFIHVQKGVEFLKKQGKINSQILQMIGEHHIHMEKVEQAEKDKNKDFLPGSMILTISDEYDYFLNRSKMFLSGEMKNIKARGGSFGHGLIGFMKSIFIPYPLTTIVRLSDNRIGVVEQLNMADLTRPVIKIVKQMAAKIAIDEVDLSVNKNLEIIEVLKETPNPSVQSYLKRGYN